LGAATQDDTPKADRRERQYRVDPGISPADANGPRGLDAEFDVDIDGAL
jgi:hypothetical protein